MPLVSATYRLRQTSSDDVLAALISGLELLQATSNIVANVPFFSGIVGSVLGLARTIQKVSGDKDRYVRLARRATELSMHIEESIESNPHPINETLKVNLLELQMLLTRIGKDVEKHLRRSALTRFLQQSSIASALDDHIDALDSAWRTFDTACLIALRMKMESQALYDDRSQLRLFRWSDLRRLRVRGKHRIGMIEVGEEWDGKWDGRAVVIRTIKEQPRQSQIDYASLVTYYPNMHHPYVAQVIGYSHPSLLERFYVVETGVVPLMHQFRGRDIYSRILLWLQHIVDYQDAFHFLEDLDFPVNDCHSHDNCLPSAMLNEEGRLIIEASDFYNSNLGCFQSCLRTLHDGEHGALSPGRDYAEDEDIASHASALMRALRAGVGLNSAQVDVEPFINSSLAKIWASHQFQSDINAQWGDYGYIKRDSTSETFSRLGHIYDFVEPTGKISTFLLSRLPEQDWQPAKNYPWPDEDICHVFELDNDSGTRIEDIAVVRTIPDDSEYHDFFWNHAELIARQHGLDLHQIVLFEEIFHYAGAAIDWDSDDHDSSNDDVPELAHDDVPSKLYFHQLPLLSSGEAPDPWGYWSLEPEPTPGPWPTLDIPGVRLTCRVRYNYSRVSTFEAEMLAYLNQLRRNRRLVSAQETPPVRFEELD